MSALGGIEPGLPVELGRIDKALGALWEESGDSKTRASLINLAIYTESAEAVAENTALIAEIASEHACRAILVLANPSAEESQARAWINAHCHVAGKGGSQICSEQITFQLDGDAVESLANIVFSHLDSDLPLCFWWRAAFCETIDEKLWSWVDRLIFDSASWGDPGSQFDYVRKIAALADSRTVVCDLNWTRLLGTRFAIAQFFDHAYAVAHLRAIDSVVISCASRSTGVLLLGWLAAQLKWKMQDLLGSPFFVSPGGKTISFQITDHPGADIGRVVFRADEAEFELVREAGSDYFHAAMRGPGAPEAGQILAAGRAKLGDLLLVELSRGGRHPLYHKSLAAIEGLWGHG